MSVAYWEILKTTQIEEKKRLGGLGVILTVQRSTPGARVKITQEPHISVKITAAAPERDSSNLRPAQSSTGQELDARHKGCTITSRSQGTEQANNDMSSA